MVIGIYGAGGLGREVFDTVCLIKKESDKIIFIDDINGNNGLNYASSPIVTFDEAKKIPDLSVIIAVGEPSVRERLHDVVRENNIKLCSVIHPMSNISPFAKIGEGVYVGAFTHISCNVTIADNVLLQPHCVIGHDSSIGTNSLISSFAEVCGHCNVGESTYISIHSVIKQGVSVGSNTIIGFSSVVHKDIDDCVVAMGNPARILSRAVDTKVF